ncbi:vancomycin high temperature exclusion protein [Flavobacteriaceae bacterium M23B6Z8]
MNTSRIKKFRIFLLLLVLIALGAIGMIYWGNSYIHKTATPFIFNKLEAVPKAYTVIVPGARVYEDGTLSPVLKDRVETALTLFKSGKVSRFLLTGDHGQHSYDEVNAMKAYLQDKGVSPALIFTDHAGFDTYDSMYRAKEIFKVNDAIVVTQEFHLPRAVFLGRKFGIKIYGCIADKRIYQYAESMARREKLANVKALLELFIGKKPTYLGDPIPIDGDSALSHD